ncbi:MAG: tRNA dihydrouridine synthase DusB, partial [Clostridiales bacterium]|nr:tRNA dihydrouridine synthase DusB [Clostridiales bacterium]
QIFGCDVEAIRQGARLALEQSGADILDINMGCPTPKITSNGDGSALMKNIPLASEIIKAASSSVNIPVTVKMRLGWDEDSINAVEFAKACEDSGAAALAVHGRTKVQMYSGKADWDMIAEVKHSVSIPVIANGDVFTPSDGVAILKHTGADLCMIGRGALGCPWIFAQTEAAIEGREIPPSPSVSDRFDIACTQILNAVKYKGEYIAMLEARKHLIWYMKGLRGSQSFKTKISKLSKTYEMLALIEEIKHYYA